MNLEQSDSPEARGSMDEIAASERLLERWEGEGGSLRAGALGGDLRSDPRDA